MTVSRDSIDILVPMVSFCDIPFSQIVNHINSYGAYGIGLKKIWAERNGLNPVLYVERESTLANNFIKHLMSKIAAESKKISDLTQEQKYIVDVIRYMKNYQGTLSRSGKKDIFNYRFSDEREWRYVLNPDITHSLFGNLKKISPEQIQGKKRTYNDSIADQRLVFEPEDINYIIIKKEAERDDVIRNLERVKGKYPHDQVKRLTSRIISTEQINTDF